MKTNPYLAKNMQGYLMECVVQKLSAHTKRQRIKTEKTQMQIYEEDNYVSEYDYCT